MTGLIKLEEKRQGVFGMMAGSTHPRTGKLVTAEAETLRLIELVNDYGDVIKLLGSAYEKIHSIGQALAEQREEVKKANGLVDELREERDHLQKLAASRGDKLEAAENLANFRGKNISSQEKLIADRDKRIAELSDISTNPPVSLEYHNSVITRMEKAEAELARRDAAAREPIAWVTMQESFCDEERTVITNKIDADKYSAQCYDLTPLCAAPQPAALPVQAAGKPVAFRWQGVGSGKICYDGIKPLGVISQPLYTDAQPAALPPEMKAEPDKHDVIDHGFIAGYNKAIADAKALGCQPPKIVVLPKPCMAVIQGGHAVMVPYAGGHWWNKTAILEALDAAGVKWKKAAGGSIDNE